jgi:phthalate 4,5-dioxygenase oxygenase subunit
MLDWTLNEKLVRVGPRTPMGEVFRRFWVPVCQARDVPHGGAPLPVRLLGEDLLAWRGTDGQAALVDRFCAHRGADLQYGRIEVGGLRCIFHGWQYDAGGQCREAPNIAEGPQVCSRVRIKAYPVRESGGLIWSFMGPPDQQPAFPVLPWVGLAEDYWSGSFVQTQSEGNYLQHLEGLCDGSHVGFLHANLGGGGGGSRFIPSAAFHDRTPTWAYLEPTAYGAALGLQRKAADGRINIRLNQFVLPFSVEVPTPAPYDVSSWQTNVPMDDENTMFFYTSWHDRLTLQALRAAVGDRSYEPPELLPGTYRPRLNRSNRYEQDRGEYLRTQSFSGIRNLRVEDMAVAEYVRGGLIADRSAETLVSSDRAIVTVRKRLLGLADQLQRDGHLQQETQALASLRIVPAERELDSPEAVREVCRGLGVSAA